MKQEEWSVYKHTTPVGKIYIGITHQKPELRWLCGHGYKSNKHFYNAIMCYGWKNISHEIVADGLDREQAETLERELILKYKSYDRTYGYNKALGGHVLSDESRRKISETRKARQIPSWNQGKHHSEYTKAKISEAHKGIHYSMSEEGKRHISESKRGDKNPNYGKPMKEETKKALIAMHERPVVQIKEDSEIIFRSAKEAGIETGVASCNIVRVCKGERATAGGYVWRYAVVK